MLVEVNETSYSPANLKVIGMGGAGGNAVNRMLLNDIRGVEFLVANTDIQALRVSACPNRIQIGSAITGGLGSGGDPSIGRKAAEEDREAIRAHLEGADMIFITAGMGGGTGTGASPVVAEIARELGALTVGIVTRPFNFEGRRRMRQADEGLEALRSAVDTLIVIPNQRLLQVVERNTPLNEALRVADDVLAHAAKGISEIITVPGLINVDFADVRSVMRGMGNALMGMGFGTGPDRAREAAQMAVSSPLLEDISISGAKALLVNFLGGEDMTLAEVEEASNAILEAAGDDANVIFGAVIAPQIQDEIRVTLIATGFGTARAAEAPAVTAQTERVMADEFRGKARPAPVRVPALAEVFHRNEAATSGDPEEVEEETAVVAEVPTLIKSRPVPPRPYPREAIGRPLTTGSPREAVARPMSQPGQQVFEEGVVGSARPIRRSEPLQAAAVPEREQQVAVSDYEEGALDERGAQAEATAASLGTAAIPDQVVPLVWQQNLRGREWSPTMSSRWQRVLRRDRLDVPSFMRKRQVD